MRNDGAQSTGSYSGAGTTIPYNTTSTSNGTTSQSVARPADGGDSINFSDGEKSVKKIGGTIQTYTTSLKDKKGYSYYTEDSLEYGDSIPNAVPAYKGQILNDQGNKNIAGVQNEEKVLETKTRLENEQGWHFMKKLDGDCVYVGYHFVNKGTIGINGNGEVVNFDQNESFALVGR